MSVWSWIAIGLASWLVLSVIFAFVLVRILGRIGREISGIYEAEAWSTLPPSRALGAAEDAPAEVEAGESRGSRVRT
jgi:hypothetical protein